MWSCMHSPCSMYGCTVSPWLYSTMYSLYTDMGSECRVTGWIWCHFLQHVLAMYSSLPQATAGLLFYFLKAQPIVTFYKLNVHAGERTLIGKESRGRRVVSDDTEEYCRTK